MGDISIIKNDFFAYTKPLVRGKSRGNSFKIYHYGKNNEFFDYLTYLYNNCSKHKSIVDYKVMYICGGNNSYRCVGYDNGDDDGDLFRKVVFDYVLYGGFSLKVLKEEGKITKVRYLPFNYVRKTDNGNIYAVSDEYTENHSGGIDSFTMNSRAEVMYLYDVSAVDDGTCLFYYSNNDNGGGIYPLPDYSGAINYIDIDIRVSNFWNNSIKNNFSIGYLVNINSPQPSEDEKRHTYNELKKLFTGDENAGSFLVYYSSLGDKAIDIKPLESNNWQEMYQSLNETVQQEIFIAHKVTSPMLLGVKTSGQLGGRSELMDAYRIFNSTIIIPIRELIIKKLRAVNYEVTVEDFKPITDDISQYKDILTRDEIRELLGYGSIDEVEDKEEGDSSDAFIKKKVVSMLSKINRESRAKYVELDSGYTDGSIMSELKLARNNKFGSYIITYTAVNVLKLLKADGGLSTNVLSKAVFTTEGVMKDILEDLENFGYINKLKSGSYILTKKGLEAIEDFNADSELKTMVVYSYEWLESFSDEDFDNSREFCQNLMRESDKRKKKGLQYLWTREEIDVISKEVGRDVFSMRGGWYRIPGTEISVPHCRHQWKQYIIKKL